MAIGNLKGKVDEGFAGVHRRQDITNGRLARTEERVGILEKTDAGMGERLKGVEKNTTKIDGRAWEIVRYILFFVIGGILVFVFK
jgi:hypothetical protein